MFADLWFGAKRLEAIASEITDQRHFYYYYFLVANLLARTVLVCKRLVKTSNIFAFERC